MGWLHFRGRLHIAFIFAGYHDNKIKFPNALEFIILEI